MKRFSQVLAVLRSIAWLLVPLYLVFVAPGQLYRAVHDEANATRSTLADQGDKTRALISDQLSGMRQDITARTDVALQRVDAALRTLSVTEVDANAQITRMRSDVRGIGTMADSRLASIQKDANGQLSGIAGQLAGITKPASDVAHQIDDALPYILDCDPSFAGQDCVPNKYLEVSHEGEAALKAITNATPQMVTAANGIAADVHAVADDGKKAADKFVTPPTAWEKFRAIVTGALVVLVKAGL